MSVSNAKIAAFAIIEMAEGGPAYRLAFTAWRNPKVADGASAEICAFGKTVALCRQHIQFRLIVSRLRRLWVGIDPTSQRALRVDAQHNTGPVNGLCQCRADNVNWATSRFVDCRWSSVLARGGRDQQHQPELSNLNLVAAGQHSRIDQLAVDVGAVETANVDDLQFTSSQTEFSVVPAHGHVFQEDIAARIAARCRDSVIQRESETGVGAAVDDEHGGIPSDVSHGAFGRSLETSGCPQPGTRVVPFGLFWQYCVRRAFRKLTSVN